MQAQDIEKYLSQVECWTRAVNNRLIDDEASLTYCQAHVVKTR